MKESTKVRFSLGSAVAFLSTLIGLTVLHGATLARAETANSEKAGTTPLFAGGRVLHRRRFRSSACQLVGPLLHRLGFGAWANLDQVVKLDLPDFTSTVLYQTHPLKSWQTKLKFREAVTFLGWKSDDKLVATLRTPVGWDTYDSVNEPIHMVLNADGSGEPILLNAKITGHQGAGGICPGSKTRSRTIRITSWLAS